MNTSYIMSRVLHRDGNLLVIDKPAGLPVHRTAGAPTVPTLTDWLDALRFGLPRRPDLAHRLDRDTSGCLVLGRHRQALARLAELFRSGEVRKLYWAVVAGGPAEEAGTIEAPLARDPGSKATRMRVSPDGLPARTRWRVLGRDPETGRTWLALEPETGRTHQLRVHCAWSGWPIVGDRRYGTPDPSGLLLHARSVVVPFRRGREPVSAVAPVPEAFGRALRSFPPQAAASSSRPS